MTDFNEVRSFYHVAAAAHLSSILRHGLVRRAGWYSRQFNSVFLWRSVESARHYAATRRYPPTVILEVRVPEAWVSRDMTRIAGYNSEPDDGCKVYGRNVPSCMIRVFEGRGEEKGGDGDGH